MGYGVYWCNGRWQGYQIPAYCDYPGCNEEIDRGMGYQHEQDHEEGNEPPNIFCCEKHSNIELESFEVDYNKEHPEWLEHILTHKSWNQWREENQDIVEKYKILLEESK